MGFNSVYQCLLSIFPEVDKRMLKAVAIENSNNVDAAAETILTEVIPYLSKSSASSSSQNGTPTVQIADEGSSEDESSHLRHRTTGKNACFYSKTVEGEIDPNEDVKSSSLNIGSVELLKDSGKGESSMMSQIVESEISPVSNTTAKGSGNNESVENTYGEELIMLGKIPEKGAECGPSRIVNVRSVHANATTFYTSVDQETLLNKSQSCSNTDSSCESSLYSSVSSSESSLYSSVSSSDDTVLTDQSCSSNGYLNNGIQDCEGSVELVGVTCEKSPFSCPVLSIEDNINKIVPSSAQEITPKGDLNEAVGSGNNSTYPTHFENLEGDSSSAGQYKQDSVNDMGDYNSEPDLDIADTRSSQICRIDILEEIIEDSKSNKKTLFQAMETVIDLMKQVDLEEEAAELAKQEASSGGLDVLVKVEELKQMLAHAKEANDMHAGEVYGEKAILATEVRELQSRLLSLSKDKDQSLAILDEMRQTLEERRAAAERLRKESENEKLEKEKFARSALTEQEAIMEKVVQESKILQQEAEENSKLHDFLMERGHAVDLLQGEVSVICQDVRLLKQKFDDRVPLSKSISSSQTSCILASSGSSVKSLAGDVFLRNQVESTKISEKISSESSVDEQSPKGRPEEDKSGTVYKDLLEDGWDLLQKDAELCG